MCVGGGRGRAHPSARQELQPAEGPLEFIHYQVRHPPDVAPAALTQTHQADILIAPYQPTVACNDARHTHTFIARMCIFSDTRFHPWPCLSHSPRAVVLGISLSAVMLLVSTRSFDGVFMTTPPAPLGLTAAVKSRLGLDGHGCLTSMQDGVEGEGEGVERNAHDDSWSSWRVMSSSTKGRGQRCVASHTDLINQLGER